MLKNISNLGKTLNKAELETINGGISYCMFKNGIGPRQNCAVFPTGEVLGCPRAEWCNNNICSC